MIPRSSNYDGASLVGLHFYFKLLLEILSDEKCVKYFEAVNQKIFGYLRSFVQEFNFSVYLRFRLDAWSEVGQDRDGRERDQHGADHVTRDPARNYQEEGVSTAHHLLQVEGHAAREEWRREGGIIYCLNENQNEQKL